MALGRTLRKKPDLDMNPMVDMAFLLVSFFMMTTTFKANLPEDIAIPPSASEVKLPEKNLCTINISEAGTVYFSVDNKHNRRILLERMGGQYGITFTEEQKETFSLMNGFGVPIAELPNLLDAKMQDLTYPQPGIPAEGENSELHTWILTSRLINPGLRFAINADRNTRYPHIHAIFELLRELNITRFNLVTDTKKSHAAED